jgi:hypothetical protein
LVASLKIYNRGRSLFSYGAIYKKGKEVQRRKDGRREGFKE